MSDSKIIIIPRVCGVTKRDLAAIKAAGYTVVTCKYPELIQPLGETRNELVELMRDAAVTVCRQSVFSQKFAEELLRRLLDTEAKLNSATPAPERDG